MLISNKGKKFLTGRRISYLCCLWAWPGSNIFKNFFNKKFLDLSLEYTLNSAGYSGNIDFFDPFKYEKLYDQFKSYLGTFYNGYYIPSILGLFAEGFAFIVAHFDQFSLKSPGEGNNHRSGVIFVHIFFNFG